PAGTVAPGTSAPPVPVTVAPVTAAPVTAAPVTAAPPAGSSGAAGLVTAAGAGWTASGLDGPVPAAGTCHYGRAADGYPLPDPACTPGAVDPTVTQADLRSTVCRAGGYSRSVRPPERLSGPFKRLSEAAYRDPRASSGTELDHLVPLGLGGASDTRNLWAQPDQGRPAQFDPQDPFGINAKDGVEDRLHDAVCRGQVGLAAAQQAIASDWTTALARLGVSP
ncbi:MAG TPA: hypothetical protein VFN68_03650, partial [Acidimicrobiales bacterium]|nr:hypothetical protein [Acidimicrobiales bacterium]